MRKVSLERGRDRALEGAGIMPEEEAPGANSVYCDKNCSAYEQALCSIPACRSRWDIFCNEVAEDEQRHARLTYLARKWRGQL